MWNNLEEGRKEGGEGGRGREREEKVKGKGRGREGNQPTKSKLTDTENKSVVTRGKRGCGWAKGVKGIDCMVTDGNWTFGG